jgi:hypothetical protein
MISIKTAFGFAASGDSGFSTFWLLVFAIAILDDAQARDKRRKKRDRDATPPRKPKPPAGPCP